jgi:hypothetical protein
MTPASPLVVKEYTRKLAALLRQRPSVWKDTELRYPKKAVKRALMDELAILDHRPRTDESREMRKALVVAFTRLAYFIPPDDAQLLMQAEKLTWQIAEKRVNGQTPTHDEHQRLIRYERPSMRLNAKIIREERLLIAEVAAYNAGWKLESNEIGVRLTAPKFEPSLFSRVANKVKGFLKRPGNPKIRPSKHA